MKKQNTGTPGVAIWLLQHIADPEDAISMIGDVEEDYKDICPQRGKFKAKCWIWHQILISLLPFFKSYVYWSFAMLKNYLKIAIRVIKKHKGYSFINITGLAVGIACCVLILLWVQDELRFDRFHKNHNLLIIKKFHATTCSPNISIIYNIPIISIIHRKISNKRHYCDNIILPLFYPVFKISF